MSSAPARAGVSDLARRFVDRWGVEPTHIARAPGRANLIGEHIDYCGLSVLPVALGRSVRLAFAPTTTGEVRVATTERGLEPCRFPVGAPIEPAPRGDWSNYVRAAVQEVDPKFGFDGLIDADVPVAGGLSSSSALVIATALAARQVDAVARGGSTAPLDHATRLALADRLALAERYVGTAGGGMDQAVCLLGQAGHALRVDFAPLHITPIPIPDDWSLILAFSGERAEKSGAAQALYNARTAEAREAARRVWAGTGKDPFEAARNRGLWRYRDLVSGESPPVMPAGSDPTLAARFAHIVGEAYRVRDAETALRARDLPRFGDLLTASHTSLREQYEVSTPQLDRLVETAIEAGAAGARLTGAGLGGHVVAVCAADREEDVMAAWSDSSPFIAVPSQGADVHALSR